MRIYMTREWIKTLQPALEHLHNEKNTDLNISTCTPTGL